MCNKAAVVVAKDADAFLLLVYVLGQSECFLRPWHTNNDSNPFVNIRMIFDNFLKHNSAICDE